MIGAALATAKYLINSPKELDGYTELHLRKRLDLTVEAMIVEDKRWHSLFTEDELDKARKRLVKFGYHRKRTLCEIDKAWLRGPCSRSGCSENGRKCVTRFHVP